MPAASATIYNNPGLAWTGNTAKNKGANKVGDGKQKDGSVALIINIEEKNYMALKYQAQVSGKTTQELIRTAIHNYIDGQGILRAKDWVISPSN